MALVNSGIFFPVHVQVFRGTPKSKPFGLQAHSNHHSFQRAVYKVHVDTNYPVQIKQESDRLVTLRWSLLIQGIIRLPVNDARIRKDPVNRSRQQDKLIREHPGKTVPLLPPVLILRLKDLSLRDDHGEYTQHQQFISLLLPGSGGGKSLTTNKLGTSVPTVSCVHQRMPEALTSLPFAFEERGSCISALCFFPYLFD